MYKRQPSFFFYRERLLRRCGKAVWKGRIHEAVEPFGKVVREDIMIEHRKVGTGDPDRNLRIFEQMLREKGKLSPRDQYYYGKELYYHRRYRDAASVFSEYLELPDGWREDRVDACRHGAYCMYPVSYTHLDVYKRQEQFRSGPQDHNYSENIGCSRLYDAGGGRLLSLIHISASRTTTRNRSMPSASPPL